MDFPFVDNRRCIVLAMEVWDNLGQDIVMYDDEGNLMEAVVDINEEAKFYDIPGKYSIRFQPVSDGDILSVIRIFDEIGFVSKSLKWSPQALLSPLGFPQFNRWQYLPTGICQFLKTMKAKLPNAHLLVSDFERLPDTIPGHGAPVVQTRFKGDTVRCSTILLKKGLFDIFFPINFPIASKMVHNIVGKQASIIKHGDFLFRNAEIDKTRTSSGYNPLLEEFENVSFLMTL